MSAEKLGEQQQGRRRRRLFGQAEAPQPVPVAEPQKGITTGKGRATPSRRRAEEEEEQEGNVVQRTTGGLREYFEGVQSELSKVTWPTREEARRLTIIVLVALIVSSIILGLISAAFTELFRIGLSAPLVLMGFMVVAVGIGVFFYLRGNRRTSSF
jgi:preprotein translocase subunit SecE